MTNWTGKQPSKAEAAIAKNYLNSGELDLLNRIVTAYLEFAELQALNQTPMYMKDWVVKLDDFLRLSGRELLNHAGTISHQQALQKAQQEHEKYQQARVTEPQPVDQDFEAAVKKLPKPGK